MTPTGTTAVYAVVGSPVRRSLSPTMHNRWFELLGIDAVYLAFEVDPAAGSRIADAIRTLGVAGVNLTVPFKAAILPQLDVVDPLVSAIGAANCVINTGGRLTGYNTDADGFVLGFEEDFGAIAGRNVVVLGAGGAGQAVADGVRRAGGSVTVLNRTAGRADGTLDDLVRLAPSTDVVVDCTTGSTTVDRFDVALLPSQAIWCDVNYWRTDSPAPGAARRRGLRVQDGLAMLVHQGALSFERFTGTRPPTAPIRAQLR